MDLSSTQKKKSCYLILTKDFELLMNLNLTYDFPNKDHMIKVFVFFPQKHIQNRVFWIQNSAYGGILLVFVVYLFIFIKRQIYFVIGSS